MRYACRTGFHQRCPGRWCTCPCHREDVMRPTEWTREHGTTNAPVSYTHLTLPTICSV